MRPALHVLKAASAVVPQDGGLDGPAGQIRSVGAPCSTFLSRVKRCQALESSEDNDRAITPSIRVKDQPKTFDEKVAQKAHLRPAIEMNRGKLCRCIAGQGLLFLQCDQ